MRKLWHYFKMMLIDWASPLTNRLHKGTGLLSKEPTIISVASGFNSSATIDTNFDNIKKSFNNTVSRDGSTPNVMDADFDMNSNDILNVDTLGANTVMVGGIAMSLSTLNTAVSNTQRFLLSASSDPTTRDDGTSALVVGDIYYNTSEGQVKIWTGSAFALLNSSSITIDTFTGDNSTVAFTLSTEVSDENNTLVYIDGVVSHKSDYSIVGTTLTFSTAPGSSAAIEVSIFDLTAIDSSFTKAATRTALKAVSTSLVVHFDGSLWKYDSSITSGTYTADSAEGIYVSPTGSGSGAWVRQLEGSVISPKWFGAVGDGSTEDSAGLLACLNMAANRIVDGEGFTYRLDSVIAPTSENFTFRNAHIDISNVAAVAGLSFSGSLQTATNLAGAVTKGDSVLTVASTTGFVVDGYAWLKSASEMYAPAVNAILAVYVKIKSVDSSTQVTLYDDVPYTFAYASPGDITLAPVTLKDSITFDNISLTGANSSSQIGLSFDKCSRLVLRDCDIQYVDFIGIYISQCVDVLGDGVSVKYARGAGLAYGFEIANGSLGVRITNGFCEDCRHYVTVGDNGGVNMHISVINNHIISATDAGIDSHPSADYFTVVGNTIEGASVQPTGDGIVCQAPNFICSNNTIIGSTRHGILYQPLTINGSPSAVITGNIIRGGGDGTGTDIGINCQNSGTVDSEAINISNNIIDGVFSYGVYMYASAANFKRGNVSGNIILAAATYGIYFRADAGFSIDKTVITGNTIAGSGTAGVYLLGVSTGRVNDTNLFGNICDGFTFGVRCTLCASAIISKNTILNFSDPYEIDTGSTGIELDLASYGNPQTITNSAFTMEEDDTDLIFNRAATITLTLRSAAVLKGHELRVKTIQAQTVVSASSNVVPIDSATAGTAILPATDGAWALLKSDGTNWVIMQQG